MKVVLHLEQHGFEEIPDDGLVRRGQCGEVAVDGSHEWPGEVRDPGGGCGGDADVDLAPVTVARGSVLASTAPPEVQKSLLAEIDTWLGVPETAPTPAPAPTH